jgi:ketosteroid isomerase-like protein
MGPSGDTGFTWGHYEAHGTDSKGQPIASSGRYITFWKKVAGHWKVALDASSNDAPAASSLP